MEPYEQSYEGYMGNWGNTLDRWCRRVALVVFPAEREFAIRAEASTRWALERIAEQAAQGDADGARARARELEPWTVSSPGELRAALTAASATLLRHRLDTVGDQATSWFPDLRTATRRRSAQGR
jgi:hypothetical protein